MHQIDLPGRNEFFHFAILALFLTLMNWFVAIVKESAEGYHTKKVQAGLRMGMLLFIVSEIMFFAAFFWSFFHFSLAPSIAIGMIWPPLGTQHLDIWGLPLVNTILLLSSGVTITLAHAYLLKNNKDGFGWNLQLTIGLGICFLLCQAFEYKYGVKFSWRENIYGSIFFITTGFHGLHVTIGTLFLLFCWIRFVLTTTDTLTNKALVNTTYGFNPDQHFGFEAAAWYWHFVDVVWLFLFITIYWW